jgi:hypothetical protein
MISEMFRFLIFKMKKDDNGSRVGKMTKSIVQWDIEIMKK